MDIIEIIKRGLIFPSKNLEVLSIYAIFTVLAGAFAVEGIINFILGLTDIGTMAIGIIYIAIAVIIGVITRSISIQCVKSGIELQEKIPDLRWWENWDLGLKKIAIMIFYFLIPALIVVFIGLITNIPGNILNLSQEITLQITPIIMGSITIEDALINASFPLFVSLAITLSAGILIFSVASFFQVIGEARLAHTGSLKEALNFIAVAKDLKLIGVGKVILMSVIILVIAAIIETIFTLIFNQLVVLSILTIVITPYLAMFGLGALGFLYSDIV